MIVPTALADIAVVLFAVCNTVHVIAYVPQIVRIGRDTQGAPAISCGTWSLFRVSNVSTVAYAVLVTEDWSMAALFAANAACCIVIVGLTCWKRAALRETRKEPGSIMGGRSKAVWSPGAARHSQRSGNEVSILARQVLGRRGKTVLAAPAFVLRIGTRRGTQSSRVTESHILDAERSFGASARAS